MKNTGIILLLFLTLVSCKEQENVETVETENAEVKSEEAFIAHLAALDDSLSQVISTAFQQQDKFPVGAYQKAIEQHLAFYTAYPKNEAVAESLDKAQSFYTQLRAEDKAVKWRDTIIFNFKNYKNRARVLESQGVYFDADNYNPEKIKLYYSMLLEDYPELDSMKRAEIQYRLDNVNLTFEELIQLNNK